LEDKSCVENGSGSDEEEDTRRKTRTLFKEKRAEKV